MEIEALGTVGKEAFLLAHSRPSDVGLGQAGDGEMVHHHQAQGEQEGEPPAGGRVDDELDSSGAPPGHLRPMEGPAQVKTHHRHPRYHREREEIPDVAEDLALQRRESVRAVVDKNEECCQEEDGDHIANDDLAMEIIKFGNSDIYEKGNDEEDTADHAADGVDDSELRDVIIETSCWFLILQHTYIELHHTFVF